MKLSRKKRYLQVALNSTLGEAQTIISKIPFSGRILIEAGTPFIKVYGARGIKSVYTWSLQRTINPYVVADLKTADLGGREVEMAVSSGASAVTCAGVAPVETIDLFIKKCREVGADSMVDMMNVKAPVLVLKKLKNLPDVVVLHRGVDEERFNPEKKVPFNQIKAVKSNFDIMVSVAGGDTFNEVQRAVFNDADIVVLWKDFYESSRETTGLAKQFLKEIR